MKRNLLFIILLQLYFSLSSQDFWIQISLPDSLHSTRIAESSSGELLLTTNHGVFKSTNNGIVWSHTGDIDEYLWDIAIVGDVIYAGYTNLYKSQDSGQSFQTISSGIDLLSLMVNSQNTIYIGKSGGIYKSEDGGGTWEWVHQTGNSQLFLDFIEKDTSLYAASEDLGGEVGGVFISNNNGSVWTQHALEKSSIQNIILDNNNRILVTSNGSITFGPGLFRSDNEGHNFENIYSENEVNVVAVDQYGGIYIGLESDLAIDWGVKYSSDDGETWEDRSSGLIECSYFNQIYVSSNNYIYAITQIPFKLYRSLNPIVTIKKQKVNDLSDIIIQPNPFVDETIIRFTSNNPNHVIIQVFNALGEVIFCYKEDSLSCQNGIILDLSQYPSGLYFVSILREGSNITKKIIKI